MEYPFAKIEKKWQNIWQKNKIFNASNNSDKKKYYVLSMFPYPSGALHMGHVSNYSIGDAIARYKLMQGFNVMQPMGYDAFGMPAENFAIQHNSHPKITTEENIEIMRKQFDMIGFGLDWDREVSTCRPDYYKWGQWFFKKMYENGLAYKKSSFVNWCDDCQTVLANEQVEEGKCWRCDSTVRQKELEQWFFKITKYADELLNFSGVIDWPQRVKTMQTNWIGKSFGTNIHFKLENADDIITVFTTRPDTIFGCSFMALPPEHPLVTRWLKDEPADSEFTRFCEKVINEDKITRSAEDTTKEGIFSGRFAINPVNGEKVQIWVTNYVLMDYGTGAVMAVPTHDQRDFEFARKYDIPMKIVIQNPDKSLILEEMTEAYIEPGTLVNSKQFDGMDSVESKKAISNWMQENGMGEETITYRLQDWGVSRQRYWGNPIPIIYCDKCGEVLVPDKDLPVLLPDNVELGKTTQNPLLSVPEWVNTTCPKCSGKAKRETDTMDTFVDSSWYFARYADADNEEMPFAKENADYWLPVDQYIGGIEHAVMHLMYARFFHKFMRDIGMVSCDEPFARLLTQGMVTKDGAKMSKSKGNVVDPQYIVDRYGADTVRVFMLFASPPDKDVEWSDEGVKGAFRFLNRVWRIFEDKIDLIKNNVIPGGVEGSISSPLKDLRFSTHHLIKKVREDIEERMHFNTAIAAIMEHLNKVYGINETEKLNDAEKVIFAEACAVIPRLLYFFAPHISEELWKMMGNETLVHEAGIPEYNPEYLVKDEVTYVIQVMGKLRGKIDVPVDMPQEEIKKMALEVENVQKYIEGKKVHKVIVVPKKLVSIVAK
ncbi:MAG: leucine--tRNA ligase [Candidatus Cloacimonetes bacterium]|nr:leucine--tRNA ligase [Candidatus Cloacimonadota bacterium]MCF7814560.1 leucine--tRNA ligase [Candidatus Cloacimonadota bacterium]MCF7867774.1 leucine--tRNA ligase [Candidatus Cloacimonadota bacterium]MCF7883248.1 leucine--tRNA ligase [Candidatus Cloacimonadota bacterium]